MTDDLIEFHVRINDGPEQTLKTHTGIYERAAVAAIALLPFEEPDGDIHVEIWLPELLPDYGPYHYLIGKDDYLNLVVRTAIAVPDWRLRK